MKLTNEQIYQIATDLLIATNNLNINIPAKANFFMQKNIKLFTEAAKEIDEIKIKIAEQYGTKKEDGTSYEIPEENRNIVNKELQDLFSIEQDLDIKTFSIDTLGNAEFTPAQMQALMIMIED